ncbi:response regulator [Marinobacter persicus]|nr:response regulator [Marinobacter persicus]GHD53776.1 hypothetical protein GCM10008110_27680 [Marinobacter persicus]
MWAGPVAGAPQDRLQPLDSGWAFYWREFVPPGQVPEAGKPLTTQLSLPGSWTQLAVSGAPLPPTGYATYRKVLTLPDTAGPMVLRIPMVYSAYRLFVNGELAAQVGTPGTTEAATREDYGERQVILDTAGERVELVFHVSNYHSRNAGFPKVPMLGAPDEIKQSLAAELITNSVLTGGFLLIALFQLALFFIRREYTYLLFSLSVGAWALQTLLSGQLLSYYGWHVPLSVARPLDGFTALASGVTYLLFLSTLFPRYIPMRWTRWVALTLVIYGVVAVFFPGMPRSLTIGWLLYFVVATLVLALAGVVRAWLNKHPESSLILLASAVIAATATIQIYWMNESGIRDIIVGFGLLAAIGLHAITLARRYARAFERTQALEADLRRADRLKDEFLANTSHELKTPLHAIVGLADTLPRDNPAQRKTIDLIMHSGHRLARLVEDILAFTKIRNDALEITPEPVAVAPVVEEVVTTCHPLIGQRPVRLVTQLPDGLPPVMADSDRLYQVLFNLIGNAIKFTDEGTITLAVEQTGEALCFRVEDEGMGIPQDELSRMMKPYEQGQDSSLDGHGGVGLGLAISRQILLAHGSDLTLRPAQTGGLVASFSLPVSHEPVAGQGRRLRRAPPEAIMQGGETAHDSPAVWPGATKSAAPGASAARILVVDDDDTSAMVLQQQLTQAGYAVDRAANGPEALAAVAKAPPQLVLLDVMMPGMSGLEVCQRLREEHDPSTLPVIMVTARTRPEDVLEGFNAGANDYLAKPFYQQEMLARVQAQLTIHENEQMRWELQESRQSPVQASSQDEKCPRALLVRLLEQCVQTWELETGQPRADLAEESGLWTVTLDGSVRKTRTLDRYLSEDSLPKRPRWGVVSKTADFVREQFPQSAHAQQVEQLQKRLQKLLSAG